MPVVWGLANPKTGEREAAETMLRHDKHLIRPDRRDEKKRFGKLGGIHQWVEFVFDTLKGQLTLEDHGGSIIPGVYSRIAHDH
ncbi:Mobile element protein [Leifsonia rubra CMS 76R]|nr:Mobile element protein [Leifsonia rubra CMS 76R]